MCIKSEMVNRRSGKDTTEEASPAEEEEEEEGGAEEEVEEKWRSLQKIGQPLLWKNQAARSSLHSRAPRVRQVHRGSFFLFLSMCIRKLSVGFATVHHAPHIGYIVRLRVFSPIITRIFFVSVRVHTYSGNEWRQQISHLSH